MSNLSPTECREIILRMVEQKPEGILRKDLALQVSKETGRSTLDVQSFITQMREKQVLGQEKRGKDNIINTYARLPIDTAQKRKRTIAASTKEVSVGKHSPKAPGPVTVTKFVTAPVAPAPVAPAPVAPAPVAPAPVAPAPVAPAPVAPAFSSLADQFSNSIKDVILNVLYDSEIRTALRNLIAETLAPESKLEQIEGVTWREPKLPLKERNQRILIVGGNTKHSSQGFQIPGVDIRIWGQHSNDSLHRLKELIKNADAAVVMVTQVSHPAMNMVKSAKHLKTMYWSKAFNELKPVLEEFAKTLNG